jgi:predicted lipoprotein with Yx(FWY)xxD motif
MKRIFFVSLSALMGTVGFFTATGVGRSAGQAHATVSLRKTSLGSIAVNSGGHTLYLFRKDRNGKSSCNGSCASFWPPLIAHGKPTAGAGLNAAMLGTTKRADGRLQVTYNQHPLYAFSLDKRPGQTQGEGQLAFGARWYAVSAKGRAVLKAASPSPTTSTTTSTNCAYPPC